MLATDHTGLDRMKGSGSSRGWQETLGLTGHFIIIQRTAWIKERILYVQQVDALFLNVGFWNAAVTFLKGQVWTLKKGPQWGSRVTEPEVRRPASGVQSSFNRLCDTGKSQRLRASLSMTSLHHESILMRNILILTRNICNIHEHTVL